MKRQFAKRLLATLLAMVMVAGLMPAAFAQDGPSNGSVTWEETDNDLVSPYADDEQVRVSIVLKDEPTTGLFPLEGIADNEDAMAYRETLKEKQKTLAKKISEEVLGGEELDVVCNLTLAANIISADVEYGKVEAIKAVDGVEDAFVEAWFEAESIETEGDPEMAVATGYYGENTGMTNTPAAWDKGYYGQGMRIAIIDYGIDLEHELYDAGAFMYALEEDAKRDGKTVADYNLLTAEEIQSRASLLNYSVTGTSAYRNAKVPYGYNYSTGRDYTIAHGTSNHGSATAGVAAANRYVPDGEGGYNESLKTVFTVGQAPDAQLIVMKITSGSESQYMSAVEDAIVLGCVAANISFGDRTRGFTTTTTTNYQTIYDNLVKSGMVLTASGGNYGAWADDKFTDNNTKIEYGGNGKLYSEDVNFQTGTMPSSVTNALTVAMANVAGKVTVSDAEKRVLVGGVPLTYWDGNGANNMPLTSLDTPATTTTAKSFVLLNRTGLTDADYADVDVADKVVFLKRADDASYGAQAAAAVGKGAVAVVVYDNESGSTDAYTMDLTGYDGTAPVAFMRSTAKITTGNRAVTKVSDEVWTGAIVIGDGVTVSTDPTIRGLDGLSSWGVPGDLSVKPDLAAPSSLLYQVNGEYTSEDGSTLGGHTAYISEGGGSSCAAPQVAGISALTQQYINDLKKDGMTHSFPTDRGLIQSLLMSTAVPMQSLDGKYYAIMQQGSGMVNAGGATSADSYIKMGEDATGSYGDGKIKAELGEDPAKEGVYTFSFSINNLDGKAHTYALGADVFTQDIEKSSDYTYLSKSTKTLEAAVTTFKVNGASATEAAVPARGSVTVEVTITLDKDKMEQMLRDHTGEKQDPVKGAYVEAFVKIDETAEGTKHSIPVLGFYGSWTDPSMFDKVSYSDVFYGTNTETPYLSGIITNPYTNDLTISYASNAATGSTTGHMDVNPFGLVETNGYLADRNALNNESNNRLGTWSYVPTRNIVGRRVTITSEDGSEVYYTASSSTRTTAPYNYGYTSSPNWKNTSGSASLNWAGTDLNDKKLPEGTKVIVSLSLAPEMYLKNGSIQWDAMGEGASLTTQLTIDNTAPMLVKDGVSFDPETGTFTITAKDAQYVAAVALYSSDGSSRLAMDTPSQTRKGANATVTLSRGSSTADTFQVRVYDYATNYRTYTVTTDGEITGDEVVETVDSVTLSETEVSLKVGETAELTATVLPADAADTSVIWTSSDEAVATVDENGVITAVSGGTATITAASKLDPTVFAECEVTVEAEGGDDVAVTGVELSADEVSLKVGETATLTVTVLPEDATDKSVTWESSDEDVVTVDENGVITAVGAGTATITVTTSNDLTAECEVTVETEDVGNEIEAKYVETGLFGAQIQITGLDESMYYIVQVTKDVKGVQSSMARKIKIATPAGGTYNIDVLKLASNNAYKVEIWACKENANNLGAYDAVYDVKLEK